MKKSFDYFAAIQSQGELVDQALMLLAEADLFQMERMHELADECISLRHSVVDAALSDFLPPIDRADLLGIAAGYCEVVLQAGWALGRVTGREMEAARLAEMGGILRECAVLLKGLKKNATALLALTRRAEGLSCMDGKALEPCFAACRGLTMAFEGALVKNI